MIVVTACAIHLSLSNGMVGGKVGFCLLVLMAGKAQFRLSEIDHLLRGYLVRLVTLIAPHFIRYVHVASPVHYGVGRMALKTYLRTFLRSQLRKGNGLCYVSTFLNVDAARTVARLTPLWPPRHLKAPNLGMDRPLVILHDVVVADGTRLVTDDFRIGNDGNSGGGKNVEGEPGAAARESGRENHQQRRNKEEFSPCHGARVFSSGQKFLPDTTRNTVILHQKNGPFLEKQVG
jgi:hypothetical protein